MKHCIVIGVLFLFVLVSLLGQEYSNMRENEIKVTSGIMQIDTLSLVPGTLKLFRRNIPIIDSTVKIDYLKAQLVFPDKFIGVTLRVEYRVYPFNIYKPIGHGKGAEIKELKAYPYSYIRKKHTKKSSVFKQSEIISDGNLSRGLSFGNNQDVVVNSELNLNLKGKLSDDIFINGVITDKNIPIQPDGYSQQIQDFDRMFIEVYNQKFSLKVGDVLIKKSQGAFLRLNKKVQGFSYTDRFKPKNEKYTYHINASGSVAKGKYTSNFFQGVEGNQGPYRLNGQSGERYIVVLSGSEKVYIDGKLMERGEDRDYFIDYNTAELIFTTRQPITKDKRISVEFEYSEKNYTRFVTYTEHIFETEKTRFWLNVYSENDARNQPLTTELTDYEKQLLSISGDDIYNAFAPRFDTVTYNENEILYARIDTIVGVEEYFVYKHSTNPDSAIYRLNFTWFGANKGNYVLENQLANGRVFKWVAPDNGVPQGEYEPVVQLVSPKSSQLISAGGAHQFKALKADYEFSLSNYDMNLFSTNGDEDNIGYAVVVNSMGDFLKNSKKFDLTTNVNYQHINKNFYTPERFREVEFSRNWNLANADTSLNQHFGKMEVRLNDSLGNFGQGSFEFLQIADYYQGYNSGVAYQYKKQNWESLLSGSWLKSSDTRQSTNFARSNLSIYRKIKDFRIGLEENSEYNLWRNNHTDSILSNTQAFIEAKALIENFDSINKRFQLSYTMRKGYLPGDNELKSHSLSHQFEFGGQLFKTEAQKLRLSAHYRKLIYHFTIKENEQEESTYLSRIDYRLKLFKNAFRLNSVYELGSGMEAKKEYFYLEVNPGQGIYSWIDFNENGVQELDEFQIAEFQDEARYIRVMRQSAELEKVLNNKLNLSAALKVSRLIKRKKGLSGFVRNFSEKLSINAINKSKPGDLMNSANPFVLFSEQSLLLSNNYHLRNILGWSSNDRKFSVDYIYSDQKSKSLLVNGSDFITSGSNDLKTKYRFSSAIILSNIFSKGNKQFASDYMESKNYQLNLIGDELKLIAQAGMNWNIDFAYKYRFKENRQGTEILHLHKLASNSFFKVGEEGRVNASVSYVYNKYFGDSNTSVSYVILEGLKPGHNGVVNVAFFKKLSKFIEMNLNYSLRLSADNPAIHNAGMQVRAVF